MKTTAHRAHLERGQSIWYDGLRRGLLASGELSRLVRDGVRGVTSSPTIFEKAVGGSTDYDEALRRLVAESRSVEEIYDDLIVEDLREAADLLRPVFEGSGEQDGFVTLCLRAPPDDAASLQQQARRLQRLVARDNIAVELPASKAGLEAAEALVAAGVSVVMRPLFGVEQHLQALEACVAGLEQRSREGRELTGVCCWIGAHVSQLDTVADRVLRESKSELVGHTALAVAAAVHAQHRSFLESDRFRELAAQGAVSPRVLWLATASRDLTHGDTAYASALAADATTLALSEATLNAYLDHGDLGALAELDHVSTLKQISAAGVDLEQLCSSLQAGAQRAHGEAISQISRVLEARREAFLEQAPERQRFSLGTEPRGVLEAVKSLSRQQALPRLWSLDPSLFTNDSEVEETIRNRLGWLRSPELMQAHLDDIADFARGSYRAGRRKALVLGMGGSSLCPEVLAQTHGTTPGFLELRVLDSTDPEAVAAAERWAAPEETLVLVASKSGTTLEVRAFEAFFWQRFQERLGAQAGEHFVAITDPGSPLQQLARDRGYKRVFENPPDIGGRYSAVSFFGLVPAALIGVDLHAHVSDAQRMAIGCAGVVPPDDNPGARLGAFMAGLARRGRDKLTLIASDEVACLGSWIEQLVAESTGKDGQGIVPVDMEPLGEADQYGADRAFVYLRYGGRQPTELDQKVELLVSQGHPVARIGMLALHDLGGEFFRWEVATALSGSLLGVNPFDEPNVTEAKAQTNQLIDSFKAEGKLPDISAVTPDSEQIKELIEGAKSGDYIVLSAFFARTAERDVRFAQLRSRLRALSSCATTLGWGPRFLHSTGQLHKGGPNRGVFLVLTADRGNDLEIPGAGYGFGVLRDAQALGDLQVLQQRDRRALRVHLGGDIDAGLEALLSSLA